MIDIVPICADSGKARRFHLVEDGKRILEMSVNKLMTAEQLRMILEPKQTKKAKTK